MSVMKPRLSRQDRQFAVLRKVLAILLGVMLPPFMLTGTAVVVTLNHVDHLSRAEN